MTLYRITLVNPQEEREEFKKLTILRTLSSEDGAWRIAKKEAQAFNLEIKSVEVEK